MEVLSVVEVRLSVSHLNLNVVRHVSWEKRKSDLSDRGKDPKLSQ